MVCSELNLDMILMPSHDTQMFIYLKLSHGIDFRHIDYVILITLWSEIDYSDYPPHKIWLNMNQFSKSLILMCYSFSITENENYMYVLWCYLPLLSILLIFSLLACTPHLWPVNEPKEKRKKEIVCAVSCSSSDKCWFNCSYKTRWISARQLFCSCSTHTWCCEAWNDCT